MDRVRTLTILKTDIRGFTARTNRVSAGELDAFLNSHRAEIQAVVGRHGGHIVKEIGDSYLIAFESATASLLCAAELQRHLGEARSPVREQERVQVRIAVSSGDVVLQGEDIFGTPVNVVARLEEATPPGEVYFTESVWQNMNRSEVASESVARMQFKGIDEEVPVHRLAMRQELRALAAAPLFTDALGFTQFSQTAPLRQGEAMLHDVRMQHLQPFVALTRCAT